MLVQLSIAVELTIIHPVAGPRGNVHTLDAVFMKNDPCSDRAMYCLAKNHTVFHTAWLFVKTVWDFW